jgi:hypothetical protein
MDLRRLRIGEWIAGVSGAVLIGSLFLDWYETPAISGFETFTVIDVALVLAGVSGLALLFLTANQGTAAVPIAFAALTTIVALLAALLGLWKAVDLPGTASGRLAGLWLGLAATAGLVAGAALAMRDERLSEPGRHTDATGRPTPPPEEIEPLPAPRP